MRAIKKRGEPASLIRHRKTPHSNYGNFTGKDHLRKTLVREQQGLCCYCMGRIRADSSAMKIEHWHCQAHYPDEQLNYPNLLGACPGAEGSPPDQQHCDTSKGNQNLLWNPANPAHAIESKVEYDFVTGAIWSTDSTFDRQLNDVLNLNVAILMHQRIAIYRAIAEWWKIEKHNHRGPVPRAKIARKKAKYVTSQGDLPTYCRVTVCFLDRKLGLLP